MAARQLRRRVATLSLARVLLMATCLVFARMLSTHTILGVTFKVGSGPELVNHICQTGGLVVVPSAPVLVGISEDPSLREAVLGADMAITDSGLMVLLWRLFRGVKLERVSGLEYLKLLLERPEVKAPGAIFWIMPGEEAKARNLAWLRRVGFATTEEDCYVAPFYGQGPIRDDALLAKVSARQPRHIIVCLGGGVQERVAFAVRNALARAQPVMGHGLGVKGSDDATSTSQHLTLNGEALLRTPNSGASPVSLHCIGAAIGFLSGDQVKIPMWVDYLYLGWLWRIASAPTKFFPRYWKATRLVALMWKYGEKAPVNGASG